MSVFTYRLPERCNIQTVSIKETNGKDEGIARAAAESRGAAGSVGEELVKLAIVAIDGNPVPQPLVAWDEWSSRTRLAVTRAFDRVNGLSGEETQVFLLSGAEGMAPKASTQSTASKSDAAP